MFAQFGMLTLWCCTRMYIYISDDMRGRSSTYNMLLLPKRRDRKMSKDLGF